MQPYLLRISVFPPHPQQQFLCVLFMADILDTMQEDLTIAFKMLM
jgi:hypothetical protein